MSLVKNFQTGENRSFLRAMEEWRHYNKQQFNGTQDRGIFAEKLLERSDRVRDKVREIVEKKKNETEWRITERIGDIQFVRVELEKTRKSIQEEVEALSFIEERIQDEMKYLKMNALEIIKKCLQLRKGRTGVDSIYDEVENELEKEEKKIKEAETLLEKTLDQAKESKRDLRASLYLLGKDVEGKLSCIAIETECLNLKQTDLDLCVYQGDQPLDISSITVPEWARYSSEIIKSSEKKIHSARIFQSHVKNILEEVILDLRGQCFVVNDAFRRRILEVKKAKAKLESQLYEIVRQVNDMTRNISELQKAIQDKEGFLALAQTRLEKRSYRPGIELVKDEVEASLVKEVLEVKNSVSQLQRVFSEAEITLRYLLQTQLKLEEEINVKTNSLKIDEVDCMTLRQGINYQWF